MKTGGWFQASAAIAVLPLALGGPTPAGATTYCVETAAELQAAMTAAAASSADDAIRLVGGVFASSSPDGFFAQLGASGDLDISGGWFPGCFARNKGQRSTIDGGAFVPGMVIVGSSEAGPAASLSISHLNFIHGYTTDVAGRSGGLTVKLPLAATVDVTIDANRFFDNRTEDALYGRGGGLLVRADRNLVVSNNIFSGNHAATYGAAAVLDCGSVLARIVNNTVTGNEAGVGGADDRSGLAVQGGCFTEIANNILWGNGGIDLSLYVEGARLYNNDLADLGGDQLPAVSVGNVYANPLFVSATDLRLRRSSTLVDAGYDTPIDGLPPLAYDDGPRLVGPHVDIGAYELDRLFDDGFDPAFSIALE